MIILEGLLYAIGYYLFWSLGLYIYCVISSFNMTKVMSFKIRDGYIGIYEYPKFFLFWVDWIMKRKGRE